MNLFDATEQSYKHGYKQAVLDFYEEVKDAAPNMLAVVNMLLAKEGITLYNLATEM